MTLDKMDKDRGEEAKTPLRGPSSFEIGNFELGGESRAFGTSAFSRLSGFFLERLKCDPTCEKNLNLLLDRGDITVRRPKYRDITLAEEAFREWVKLGVKKALTDYKAEMGKPLDEGLGGSHYINLDSDAQVLESIILKGSEDGRRLVWKNKYAAVEVDPKPWFGSGRKVLLASVSLTTLAGCTVDPSPNPAITAEAPIEITEAINEASPSPTPLTQVEVPTAAVVTETPEAVETICAVNAIAELREEGLQANSTVPVLTKAGYAETLTSINPLDVSTEVEFDIKRIIDTNPTNIKKLIIPEYIDISLLNLGVEAPFEIANYESGMDMAQEGTFLLSVHAGSNGWTTAIWENSTVDRRSDLSARINGLLYEFTTTTDEAGNEIEILYQVPAQKADNTQADIAVGNCGPIVVRIESGSDWTVKSLLNSVGIDISKNPEGIWQNYEEAVTEEVPLESKLLNPAQVAERTDAEIFEIVGIPDPEEFSLNEELFASKIIRNEGGSSYVLYANKDGVVQLARNLETGVTEHAVYAESDGGVPIMILTGADVVEKDGGWVRLNNEYDALDAQARLAKAYNMGLALTWWAQNHSEDFIKRGGRCYFMKSLDEIPGYQAMRVELLTKSQRREIVNHILGRFMVAVANAKANGEELMLRFNDRNQAQFDAAKDTLVFRAALSEEAVPNWQLVVDGINNNNSVRNVYSERNGQIIILTVRQPSFSPSSNVLRPVGGDFTALLRYLFGDGYYQVVPTIVIPVDSLDMTEPMMYTMCRDPLPKEYTDNYSNVLVPVVDSYKKGPQFFCAVGFGSN